MKSFLYCTVFTLLLTFTECQHFVYGYSANSTLESIDDEISLRQPRYRPTTSVTCVTNDGGEGTCLSRLNCLRQGGIIRGFCSAFGGVCCDTSLQCGGTTRLKRVTLRNPTTLTSTDCTYNIQPYSSNVCQLLVQFQTFELTQPTLGTDNVLTCTDRLEISGYTLCGYNTGQHLYVPFNGGTSGSTFSMRFTFTSTTTTASWRILVTQLECALNTKRSAFDSFINQNTLHDLRTIFSKQQNNDLALVAPAGCDQYYTTTSGTITSFNYRDTVANSYYMANMRYVICIKPPTGSSIIQYSVRSFSLGVIDDTMNGYDNNCHLTVPTTGRDDDYMIIPQSVITSLPNLSPILYCGTTISGLTLMQSLPFVMYFVSDGTTTATETGFRIDYSINSI